MRIVRIICGLALLAGASLYGLGSASAQGSPDARQACTPDAMRLCSEFIPDVAKITACMRAKRSQLSEACRVAMAGGHKVREASRGRRHERRHERHVTHHHYYKHRHEH